MIKVMFTGIVFAMMVCNISCAAGQGKQTATTADQGWQSLFDGKTTDGWRGFKRQDAPKAWVVKEGTLMLDGRGGDLITTQQFDNFELKLEWKISPNGNSGIMYRVTETQNAPYLTGAEYQILDNDSTKYGDAKIDTNIAGSNYAMHKSDRKAAKPAGQWNKTHLIVNGNHVEQWLNGKKVVEFELFGEEWTKHLNNSKFKNWQHYARMPKGHICLQDHGDKVWFRNIKIRPLKPNTLTTTEKAEGWELLFDGKTTNGWRGHKMKKAPASWKAVDQTLTRQSDGRDLITKKQYGNFELKLQWKISPDGNSGIIYRATEDLPALWNTGPEYQIHDSFSDKHKDGDLRYLAGANYAINPTKREALKPAGRWNDTRILIKGNHVEHWLNGTKVCEYELKSDDWKKRVAASKFKKYKRYGLNDKGHIALQDHGNAVWYRNIKIRPLD